MIREHRKNPFKTLARIAYLFFIKPANCHELVAKSYDHISSDYDRTWTTHMRDLTASIIHRLNLKQTDKAVDLACGTGFATNLIAEKTNNKPIGVDLSDGMLAHAHRNYDPSCNFINADILQYLKALPPNSLDLITCCWGLGYSKPFAVLRQIKRVLKPKGKVAIIDNSFFSLREIIYCSFLTFTEHPEKLTNLMRFRFLMGRRHLLLIFRMLNMKPEYLTSGTKSYNVQSGSLAIERLIATGAAAGFEYAAQPQHQQQIFQRFAHIIEQKYMKPDGITLIHRYFAGIAEK